LQRVRQKHIERLDVDVDIDDWVHGRVKPSN
jgi:hypothetical protein